LGVLVLVLLGIAAFSYKRGLLNPFLENLGKFISSLVKKPGKGNTDL